MKKLRFDIIFCIMLLPFWGLSQSLKLKELHIGDTIPEIKVQNILGYKKQTLDFSNLRGKLVIIDFWATWCVPCVAAIPKLNKLQNEYKNYIFILPVSSQDNLTLIKAFETLPSLRGISMPLVYNDKDFMTMFPHKGLPHDIIIDQDGVVKAITYIDNINAETIDKLIRKITLRLKVKKSGDHFNFEKPLFIDSLGERLILGYGIISKSYDGLLSRMQVSGNTKSHGYTRVHGTNIDLLSMYRLALLKHLGGISILPRNKVRLSIKDSLLFKSFAPPHNLSIDEKSDYFLNHSYCFDFFYPVKSGLDACDELKNYLDNYFNIESKLDSSIMDCYVLKSVDSTKYLSRGGQPLIDLAQNYTFKNYPIQEVVNKLTSESNVPIICDNEELANKKVDITLTQYHGDFKKLKSELRKNGLDLVSTKRKMQIMVFEDRK